MSELLDRIRGRGYWHVVIRPAQYDANRIPNILSLFPLIEQNRVRMTGWDYPHVDSRQGPEIQTNWSGQETQWQHYLSIWRLYQSGQFVHIFGIGDDWRDISEVWPLSMGLPTRPSPSPPPDGWDNYTFLGTASTVFQYTEILEFAARLALTQAGDDPMYIGITLHGLRNRVLYVDDPRKLRFNSLRKATISEYPYSLEIGRAELTTRAKEIALEASQNLFRYFQWDVSIDLLRGIQQEIIK